MVSIGTDVLRKLTPDLSVDVPLELDDVEPTADSGGSKLDEQTQNGLVRFAKFLTQERPKKKGPRTSRHARPTNASEAYVDVWDRMLDAEQLGTLVDLRV